jgi:hypothetical protein
VDAARFDHLSRSLRSTISQRPSLENVTRRLLVLAPLALGVDAVAAKRKKKRKLTCRDQCKSSCVTCFNRPNMPPLCGDGYRFNCVPCSSDTQCLGSAEPYCIKDRTERGTNETRRWNCPPYPVGICADIFDCDEIPD